MPGLSRDGEVNDGKIDSTSQWQVGFETVVDFPGLIDCDMVKPILAFLDCLTAIWSSLYRLALSLVLQRVVVGQSQPTVLGHR